MTIHPVIVASRAAAIAALAAALALGTAGPAAADRVDDAFLADLESHGIYFDSPEWGVYQARYVCQELEKGRSYLALMSEGVAQSGLKRGDVAYFIQSAVTTYCPGNAGSLPS
jgi:hypothetical protein